VTVDEHLDRAFASLDQVPVRELEACQRLSAIVVILYTTSPASSVTSPELVKDAGARIFLATTSAMP
jgi:hypothetical protein